MQNFDFLSEAPMAVTVCDKKGIIVYMNRKSASTFQADGGLDLVGKSLLECHPALAREKLLTMLREQKANTYTIEKKGLHKLIHQTPWFENGKFSGLIEFSFEIPVEIPHFIRG